jgi:H+-transporting ATPase
MDAGAERGEAPPDLTPAPSAHDASVEPGLTSAVAIARLSQDGPNEVPEKKPHTALQFARKFWGASAWMLELIILLSFVLHRRADFWIALSLLVVNAVLGFVQEQRASAAITALRHRLQVAARVVRDGRWQTIAARLLVRDDVIRVRSGDFVPADARLVSGDVRVDQSALTGESRDIARTANDVLYAGSTIRQGEATAIVVATGIRTYFGRTTELVQSARPTLHVEQVITGVVKWLFAIVGVLVLLTVVLSLFRGLPLVNVLPLSLVLLMSAIPVALPVMFTVSMAVSSIDLARRGVLVTRLNAAEDAANMDVLCADKTGTLTANRLSLVGVLPSSGFTEDDVVRIGALASNEADQDPIDLAFVRAARERNLLRGNERTISFVPFSPGTRRTEAVVEDGDATWRVMKGAVPTVAAESGLDAGELAAIDARARPETQKGYRVLAVAQAVTSEPLRLAGLVLLADPVRPDSRQLIAELRSLGVTVKMLTGDALPVAEEIAHELGLGAMARGPHASAEHGGASTLTTGSIDTVDGYAEVFPEDKFQVVKGLQARGHIVAMTGDGVNDAPALRQAEVGIAVSGATDVAKAAASVVLTTEGLAGIIDLVRGGRAIYQRVLTWIINKVSRTILKAGFVVISFIATGRFVISALGMVLLVFMTDFVKVALSTDRVQPSPKPESWNIGPLLRVAVILGMIMLVEALGLLAVGWRWFDLGADAGRLQTFTFETLLFFALFSMISVRERRAFWSSMPSAALSLGLAADACAGLLVATYGLAELRPLMARELAVVVGYAFALSLLVNDVIKRMLIARTRSSG